MWKGLILVSMTPHLNEHSAVSDCVLNPFDGLFCEAGEDCGLGCSVAVVLLGLKAIQQPSVVLIGVAVECSTLVVL